MHSGRICSSWRAGFLASAFGLLAGCAVPHAQIDRAVLAKSPPPEHFRAIADEYRAHCPDVLQVAIDNVPQYGGALRIGPDGRIELGDAGRPRVDGETAPEIVLVVAKAVGVPPEHVHVQVAEHNSQYLYLFGQVAGMERAVPYQGPETVLDLLRRVGGLTPAAAPRDIRIVRPHVADGQTPEVFQIDLAAIVLRNDPETNIVLEPYDQVHIGQSRRSCFGSCLPPWMRLIYDRMCGMKKSSEF